MALRTLLRAGRHLEAAMGRRLSLGVTDLEAMDELAGTAEPIGPVELGNRLGIRSASATILVDRLEAAGHLRRTRHPRDGRRIVLETTEPAQQQLRAALAPLLASIETITARLGDEQVAVVLAFLEDVTDAMRDYTRQQGR